MPSPVARCSFDDIVIDFAGHRLSRGGVEQPLEPKAFGVLALLTGSPGRVFDRDEILDAVWGHRHVTPGVLNRVMSLLRQALGEHAHGTRYLHTVHGVGYRFDLPDPAPDAMPAAPATEPDTPPAPTRPFAHPGRPRAFPRAMPWLLLLLAALAFASWKWWPRTPPMTATPAAAVMERGIAVLPLTNASSDPDQQFFSDGLSENLIDSLSRFDGLKVIGRTSAFQFRGSKDDSTTIGRKLGVSYLLAGSVQHAGDVVRIGVELVSVTDGRTIWTEHYDRPYKDLFALQDEITQAVAGALHAELLSPDQAAKQSDRPPSGNLDAYSAYLQGLKYWHDEDFTKAAGYMTKAVQLDPGYAMAWALLSGSWSTVATFSKEAPAVAREHMRASRLAVDKALQLAPGLGPAHAARAYLHFYDFDSRGALAECRRAVQLAPDDGTVLNGCGHTLAGIGKLEEAIRLREHLLSIEPLYTVNYLKYAELLTATGRLDEAAKYLRIAEGLSQPYPYEHMIIAMLRGDAVAALKIATQVHLDFRDLDMALAAQIGPDRAAADAALAVVLQDKAFAELHSYQIARIYALRGDAVHAVQWLEHAASAPHRLFLLSDPLMLRLRDDPRFIAFCNKTGLPPPSESQALSIDQIRAMPALDQ